MSLLTSTQRPIREEATNTRSRRNTFYYYGKRSGMLMQCMHDMARHERCNLTRLNGTEILTFKYMVQDGGEAFLHPSSHAPLIFNENKKIVKHYEKF